MKKGIKIFYNILFYDLLTILILFLLLGFFANKSGSGISVGGYRIYDILTGSMSPTIKPGSLVFVKETLPNEVKKNDVITFRSDITNNVTTHRAIDIVNSDGKIEFITKGDANNAQDPVPLDEKLLIGKVIFQVPHLGSFLISLQKNKLIFIGLLVVIILIDFILNKSLGARKKS